MRSHPVLLPTVLTFASLTAAVLAAPAPDAKEAVFDDARASDQIVGVLNSTAGELHVTFTAPAGSTFGLKASPDVTVASGAEGIGLRLLAPGGADLLVAGGSYDRSKPEKDLVKWKNVPLDAFGVYTLVAQAGTPGGLLMKLGIRPATVKTDVTSDGDLDPGDTAAVEFDGRAGDTLKFDLAPSGRGSRFQGELFQVLRPDGSAVPEIPEGRKGKLVLDADGRHKLLLTNVGGAAGGWHARLSVKPRKSGKRRGLVSSKQTGLVPKVKKIDPPKGFNRDTALRVTMTGADFQEGLDVRLVRRNRADILADDIEFVSPEEVTFLLDLDTRTSEGKDSIGSWTVSVWNQPLYGAAGDRSTLDRSSPLQHASKKLRSVSAGSVRLPDGAEDATEIWQLVFNDEFQTDLDHMGLGSEAGPMRRSVNDIVQAYVIAYVRDLLLANETNGSVNGAAVPVSLILGDVTAVAGAPGVDYNRIEIGGAYEDGDPRSAQEPLDWGFAALDAGNTHRDDLMLHAADGARIGLGARTAALDVRNGNAQASSSFRLAMEPLRLAPLTLDDSPFFTGQFNPNSPAQIARFADIVEQIERAAREIAAVAAHHMGRAMGLATAGSGPMSAPSSSGQMWAERDSTTFSDGDLAALRAAAVPHSMPGKTNRLKISFFPIIDRQRELLSPNAETGLQFDVKWEFVGGRANAVPADYRVSYARGSQVPLGMTLTFEGLSGTPPTCIGNQCVDASSIYCGVLEFALLVDDIPRGTGSFLFHRLKVLPNVSLLPVQLQAQAQQCRNAVIQAP